MFIKDLIEDFKGEKKGIYSVCSSDAHVIIASLRQAAEDNSSLLVEATCNQVNQFGGYTGMKPADYRDFVYALAEKTGFNTDQIILGGDHLGTQPFKNLTSEEAMDRAKEMVHLFAEAGFSKLHLDASVRCLDDGGLSVEEFEYQACERAAEMAAVIEKSPNIENISYIVGTEVPTPGGSLDNEEVLKPTSAEEAGKTLELSKQAFLKRNLNRGWDRVCGLVVQPGVEFSDAFIHSYDRESASELSAFLRDFPRLVFEAHSTDYQTESHLTELVDDGFSILKVGPALTYAKRQAVFALGRIEKELVSVSECSYIEQVIEERMLSCPANWESHYHGSHDEISLARKYSYSDRLRYYWPDKKIIKAMEKLMANLSAVEIPPTLLYEFMPVQYWPVSEKLIPSTATELINNHIQQELKRYSVACKISK